MPKNIKGDTIILYEIILVDEIEQNKYTNKIDPIIMILNFGSFILKNRFIKDIISKKAKK